MARASNFFPNLRDRLPAQAGLKVEHKEDLIQFIEDKKRKIILRDRLMVGRRSLKAKILVRFQVPQLQAKSGAKASDFAFATAGTASKLLCLRLDEKGFTMCVSTVKPRLSPIQGERIPGSPQIWAEWVRFSQFERYFRCDNKRRSDIHLLRKYMPVSNNFDIKDGGVILRKSNLPFENKGVFNPTCIEKDGITHMFYRAVDDKDHSTIGHATFDSANKLIDRDSRPILVPEFDYESIGLEDPRITLLDGIYYIFYTAFDGVNARVAYAESKDLAVFEKKGLVTPSIKYSEVLSMFDRRKLPERYFWYGEHYQEARSKDVLIWEKDFFLFPKKIRGKFAMMHRIMPGIQFIAVERLEDLNDETLWRKHFKHLENHVVLNPELWFETKKIGGGAPPIETPYGWLMIYHAVEDKSRVYRASAVLLDLKDPRKVIGKLVEPLFSPTEVWEKEGIVRNVMFPTSALEHYGRLTIYYGAADECIAFKSLDMKLLLRALSDTSKHD